MINPPDLPEKPRYSDVMSRLASACSVGYRRDNGSVVQPHSYQSPLFKLSEDSAGSRMLHQEALYLPSLNPGIRLAIFNNVSLRGDDPESSVVSKREVALQWTDEATCDSINCTLKQVGDNEPYMIVKRSPNSSPDNVSTIEPTPEQLLLVLNLIDFELSALGARALLPSDTTPTGSSPIEDAFAVFLNAA